MKFIHNDGGRAAAGFKGETRDCVTRAIAVATGKNYLEVYNEINELCKESKKKSSARTGVAKDIYKDYLKFLGWTWTPTMLVGQGCKVHLRESELPSGKLIVSVSRHLVAVIDGVIHDTHDCSRAGSRCVYGYWKKD